MVGIVSNFNPDLTFMIHRGDGEWAPLGELQTLTIEPKEAKAREHFFSGTLSGTIDLESFELTGPLFAYKSARRLKHEQDAREALADLRKRVAMARARQLGKSGMK